MPIRARCTRARTAISADVAQESAVGNAVRIVACICHHDVAVRVFTPQHRRVEHYVRVLYQIVSTNSYATEIMFTAILMYCTSDVTHCNA